MGGDVNGLARFLVDPERIRVSLRPEGSRWRALVESRAPLADRCGSAYARRHNDPQQAVMRALRAADREELPGIDLDMQWAYQHPQSATKEAGR